MDSATMEEVQARAMRAQAVARKYLVAQWAPFVRMFSRKPKMLVKLTAGQPRTDGETTWLRVPIELGDDTPHDKALCGLRDSETAIMKCAACKIMDKVMFTIFHESAHVVKGSFEKLSDYDRRNIIIEAIRLEADGKDDSSRAAKLRKRVEANSAFVDSYIGAASLISQYLPFLLNAVEDVYVNAAMIESRPGIRLMAKAAYSDIFINGNTALDGSVSKWTDAPLDLQIVIGVLLKASGIQINDWLDPKIVHDLDDPRIEALCDEVLPSTSAAMRYRLSMKFLETLRSMGYFKAADDPEDEPEPEGPGEPGGESEGETEEPESSDEEDGSEGEPCDDGEPADTDDESEEGSGGGGDDDEDSDEEDSDGGTGADSSDDDSDEEDSDGGGGADSDEDSEGDDDDDSDDGGGGSGLSGDDDESERPTESTGADAEDSEESEDDGMGADDDTFGDEGGSGSDVEDGDVESSSSSNLDDIERGYDIFGGHDHDKHDDEDDPPLSEEERQEQEELERALSQGEHFDKPSVRDGGLKVIRPAEGTGAFRGGGQVPIVSQSVLGPALQKARIAFTNNKKGKRERNLESGNRLDGHVLATRFTMGDKRLFEKRSRPGKRDYFVIIGMDVSGSTNRAPEGIRLVEIIKQAAFAQAELCNKLGVKFAVYAHTGDYSDVLIYEVKSPQEPWGRQQKEALGKLTHYLANLDGHTLEYYRKVLDKRTETDRVILYYTDGAMPLENFEEELAVLQHNIRLCKQRGYLLMGGGVRTDSPTKHGLDTVRLDGPEDVPKVVDALRKRLD